MSMCAMRTDIRHTSPCCRTFSANTAGATRRAAAAPNAWRARAAAAIVVIEFPSYEAAMTCYRSPEYAKAIALRQAAADADLIVIEGYDGPQP